MVLAHRKGRKRWNKRENYGDSNVFQYPVVTNGPGHLHDRIHTAQKPLELMLDLVRSFTDPGEVILDSHAGSGTTGVAALRLSRRVILIEKDRAHAALCVERMLAEESGQSLESRRAKQVTLF